MACYSSVDFSACFRSAIRPVEKAELLLASDSLHRQKYRPSVTQDTGRRPGLIRWGTSGGMVGPTRPSHHYINVKPTSRDVGDVHIYFFCRYASASSRKAEPVRGGLLLPTMPAWGVRPEKPVIPVWDRETISELNHEPCPAATSSGQVRRIEQLIASATCAEIGDHDWEHVGGANCGCTDGSCSVPVHQCRRCKDSDYGENEDAAAIRRRCRASED